MTPHPPDEQDAGLRLNLTAILRRLAVLLGKTGALALPGSPPAAVREVAAAQGWRVPDPRAADAILLFTPGETVSAVTLRQILANSPAAEAVCVVARNAAVEHVEFSEAARRSHRPRVTLNTWAALQAPRWRIPLKAADICRRFGIDETVGQRWTSLRGDGTHEFYLQHRSRRTSTAVEPRWQSHAADSALTLFGLGRESTFGATIASAITVGAAALLWMIGGPDAMRFFAVAAAIGATLLCVLLEPWACRHYLANDPREVVLDEVAGMSLALALLPAAPHPFLLVLAFIAFRVFDIFKIGVRWLEKKHWRGIVVGDDLLAALYAAISVWLLAQLG